MSKSDYDLEFGGGGLMPIIQALIKSPGEETVRPPSKQRSSHPYYKRPGRGHNHDCCDACEEGGGLICCDRCPASFHLGCHDPPLSESDIPVGIWLCHHCRMTQPIVSSSTTGVVGGVATSTAPSSSSSAASSIKQSSVERSISALTSNEVLSDNSRPNTPASDDANSGNGGGGGSGGGGGNGSSSGSTTGNQQIVTKIKNIRKRSNSRMSVSSDTSQPDRLSAKSIAVANMKAQINAQQQQQQQQQQMQKQLEAANNKTTNAADDEPPKKLTPMEELVKAASIMNPRQFELPREMTMFFQFPGTDKIEPSSKICLKKCHRSNSKTKPHELDSQGLVPLPAKTCFYCRKSCKKAPLVACDYCPLYFHQDCLDPPLTALPTGLWMCPNHPEQFIDWKLVSSVSATERVKLWNRFSGPIDQDTIKAEFFRKVHNKNPPFRFKIKSTSKERIQIPAMIEYHYRNPPSLLPTLRDVLRCENVFKKGQSHELIHEDLNKMVEEDLRLIADANKKMKNITAAVADTTSSSDDSGGGGGAMDMDDDIKIKDEEMLEDNKIELSSSTPATNDMELNACTSSITDENLKTIENELKHLDPSLIHMLAFQRLQQIIQDNPLLVTKLQEESTATAIRNAINTNNLTNFAGAAPTNTIGIKKQIPLPSQLLTKDDIARIAREFTSPHKEEDDENGRASGGDTINTEYKPTELKSHVENMLPQSFNNNNNNNNNNNCNGIQNLTTDEQKVNEIAVRIVKPLQQSNIRARAVLLPVGDILSGKRWFTKRSMDGAVYMRYRKLTIGAGPGNDVFLPNIGQCAHISTKHAVIFYDDVTQNFELVNYSEFGTEVNGQLYSCDLTDYPPTPAAGTRQIPLNDPKAFYATVREIVDKRRGIIRCQAKIEDKQAKMEAPVSTICQCINKKIKMVQGWEGTALLDHGTLLRFGCLPYVFCVAGFDQLLDE